MRRPCVDGWNAGCTDAQKGAYRLAGTKRARSKRAPAQASRIITATAADDESARYGAQWVQRSNMQTIQLARAGASHRPHLLVQISEPVQVAAQLLDAQICAAVGAGRGFGLKALTTLTLDGGSRTAVSSSGTDSVAGGAGAVSRGAAAARREAALGRWRRSAISSAVANNVALLLLLNTAPLDGLRLGA